MFPPKPRPLKPRTVECMNVSTQGGALRIDVQIETPLCPDWLDVGEPRCVCFFSSVGSMIIRKSHKNSFWFKLKISEI